MDIDGRQHGGVGLHNDSDTPSRILQPGDLSGNSSHEMEDPPIKHKDSGEAVPASGLQKVLSKTISRSSAVDPGPPPDGGLQAWTQAVMSHLVVFGTWGYINSFGVFQTYYITTLGHSAADISWVGSVQIWLLFFIGTFSGRATDAGYFRAVFLAGSFFQLLGVFMTSLSTKYWQLFLAQGLCTGIGNGLLFCPCLALLSSYFTTKRAFAIAISAAGSATGGMVFPGLVEVLLPKIGFGWTVRVLGFVMIAFQALAFAFLRIRLPPRKTGPIVEWAAFAELPYTLFAIGKSPQSIVSWDYADDFSHVLALLGIIFCFLLCKNYCDDRRKLS